MNPASSLFNAEIVSHRFNKRNDSIYPSLNVVSFHNSTLPHNVYCTNSPIAAPVVTPVKEAASGHVHERVINRRKRYQSVLRVQGHCGWRVIVRRHTALRVKAPVNAFFRLGENCIMAVCPVRALACYVEPTAVIRCTEQLFVCFRGGVAGKALSKKCLAGWLCKCIAHAYGQAGRAFPTGVRAHSTRAMAVPTALSSGVSVEDICTAASWSTPGPFIRFYLLGSLPRYFPCTIFTR